MIAILERIPSGMLTAVVTAAILWLTLAPHPLPETDMPLIPGLDKIVHASMFGGLYFVVGLDIAINRLAHKKAVFPLISGKTALMLALGIVAFGGLIELLQDAMALGRGGDLLDFIADAAGVGLSVWLTPNILRRMCVG